MTRHTPLFRVPRQPQDTREALKTATPHRAILGCLFMLAACGGDSGCGSPAPYPVEPDAGGEVLQDAARARITQGALDFIGANMESLFADIFEIRDGKAHYDVAAAFGTESAIMVREGSTIAFDVEELRNNLRLTWIDGDVDSPLPGLRVSIENIQLFIDLTFAVDNLAPLPPAACRLLDIDGLAAITLGDIGFDLNIDITNSNSSGQPKLDASTANVFMNLGNASEQSIFAMEVLPCDGSALSGTGDICIDPVCDLVDAACPDACAVVDLFTDLGGFLIEILQPALDILAPSLAETLAAPLTAGLSAFPLALENTLTPDPETFAGLLAGSRPVHALIAPSGPPVAEGEAHGHGLQLGFDAGFTSPAHPCVVDSEPPPLQSMLGAAPALSGFIEVDNRGSVGGTHFEEYHMAVSLSEALLAQALWAANRSGIFCMNIGGEQVATLTGGAFALTAGLLLNFDATLAGLTHPDTPMLLTVAPTEAPALRLGAGALSSAGLQDPLLEITANDVRVGIYMMLDGVQQRISELSADLIVQVDFARGLDGGLDLLLRDVAITDLREQYNEMVPGADLVGLFEFVIDLALDTALGEQRAFDIDFNTVLGASFGLPLEYRINALRRDLGPTLAAHLSLYASLCTPTQINDENDPLCYTPPIEAPAPPPAASPVDASPGSSPTGPMAWVAVHAAHTDAVTLRLLSSSEGHGFETYEYQWRVDHSTWKSWSTVTSETFTINEIRLRLAGAHTVDVRRRIRQAPTTQSAIVSLRVETLRPLRDLSGLPKSTDRSNAAMEATAMSDQSNAESCSSIDPSSYPCIAGALLILRRRRRSSGSPTLRGRGVCTNTPSVETFSVQSHQPLPPSTASMIACLTSLQRRSS